MRQIVIPTEYILVYISFEFLEYGCWQGSPQNAPPTTRRKTSDATENPAAPPGLQWDTVYRFFNCCTRHAVSH